MFSDYFDYRVKTMEKVKSGRGLEIIADAC